MIENCKHCGSQGFLVRTFTGRYVCIECGRTKEKEDRVEELKETKEVAGAETAAYLGDGVYATFDGYQVAVRTSGPEGIVNVVYLEPDVLRALNEYDTRIRKTFAEGETTAGGD